MGRMHRFIENQTIWLTWIVTGLVSGIVFGGPLDDDTDRLIRHANIGPAKIGFSIIYNIFKLTGRKPEIQSQGTCANAPGSKQYIQYIGRVQSEKSDTVTFRNAFRLQIGC